MVADIAVSAASSIAPYAVVSSTDAVGRKRRREQKAGSDAGGDHAIVDAAATPKIAKVLSNNVVACSSSSSSIVTPRALANPQPIVTVRKTDGAKRPQMKYDPSIPMTKEETSAWRREQRRKRNRESAAACRKRQRDRISELEHEVNGWKAKFDEALRKLGSVEGEESARDLMLMLERSMPVAEPKSQADGLSMERCGTPPNVPEVATSTNSPGLADSSRVVSPYDRPKFIPPIVTSSDAMQGIHFPVLEDPIHQLKASTSSHHNQGSFIAASDSIISRVENRQHLNEKITRPAVKITGAVNPPLDTIESVCDDLLQVVPDSCLSLTEKKTMPFPETCPSLVVSATVDATASLMTTTTVPPPVMAKEEMPSVTTDESGEDSDLGEFLLDAVQWL